MYVVMEEMLNIFFFTFDIQKLPPKKKELQFKSTCNKILFK